MLCSTQWHSQAHYSHDPPQLRTKPGHPRGILSGLYPLKLSGEPIKDQTLFSDVPSHSLGDGHSHHIYSTSSSKASNQSFGPQQPSHVSHTTLPDRLLLADALDRYSLHYIGDACIAPSSLGSTHPPSPPGNGSSRHLHDPDMVSTVPRANLWMTEFLYDPFEGNIYDMPPLSSIIVHPQEIPQLHPVDYGQIAESCLHGDRMMTNEYHQMSSCSSSPSPSPSPRPLLHLSHNPTDLYYQSNRVSVATTNAASTTMLYVSCIDTSASISPQPLCSPVYNHMPSADQQHPEAVSSSLPSSQGPRALGIRLPIPSTAKLLCIHAFNAPPDGRLVIVCGVQAYPELLKRPTREKRHTSQGRPVDDGYSRSSGGGGGGGGGGASMSSASGASNLISTSIPSSNTETLTFNTSRGDGDKQNRSTSHGMSLIRSPPIVVNYLYIFGQRSLVNAPLHCILDDCHRILIDYSPTCIASTQFLSPPIASTQLVTNTINANDSMPGRHLQSSIQTSLQAISPDSTGKASKTGERHQEGDESILSTSPHIESSDVQGIQKTAASPPSDKPPGEEDMANTRNNSTTPSTNTTYSTATTPNTRPDTAYISSDIKRMLYSMITAVPIIYTDLLIGGSDGNVHVFRQANNSKHHTKPTTTTTSSTMTSITASSSSRHPPSSYHEKKPTSTSASSLSSLADAGDSIPNRTSGIMAENTPPVEHGTSSTSDKVERGRGKHHHPHPSSIPRGSSTMRSDAISPIDIRVEFIGQQLQPFPSPSRFRGSRQSSQATPIYNAPRSLWDSDNCSYVDLLTQHALNHSTHQSRSPPHPHPNSTRNMDPNEVDGMSNNGDGDVQSPIIPVSPPLLPLSDEDESATPTLDDQEVAQQLFQEDFFHYSVTVSMISSCASHMITNRPKNPTNSVTTTPSSVDNTQSDSNPTHGHTHTQTHQQSTLSLHDSMPTKQTRSKTFELALPRIVFESLMKPIHPVLDHMDGNDHHHHHHHHYQQQQYGHQHEHSSALTPPIYLGIMQSLAQQITAWYIAQCGLFSPSIPPRVAVLDSYMCIPRFLYSEIPYEHHPIPAMLSLPGHPTSISLNITIQAKNHPQTMYQTTDEKHLPQSQSPSHLQPPSNHWISIAVGTSTGYIRYETRHNWLVDPMCYLCNPSCVYGGGSEPNRDSASSSCCCSMRIDDGYGSKLWDIAIVSDKDINAFNHPDDSQPQQSTALLDRYTPDAPQNRDLQHDRTSTNTTTLPKTTIVPPHSSNPKLSYGPQMTLYYMHLFPLSQRSMISILDTWQASMKRMELKHSEVDPCQNTTPSVVSDINQHLTSKSHPPLANTITGTQRKRKCTVTQYRLTAGGITSCMFFSTPSATKINSHMTPPHSSHVDSTTTEHVTTQPYMVHPLKLYPMLADLSPIEAGQLYSVAADTPLSSAEDTYTPGFVNQGDIYASEIASDTSSPSTSCTPASVAADDAYQPVDPPPSLALVVLCDAGPAVMFSNILQRRLSLASPLWDGALVQTANMLCAKAMYGENPEGHDPHHTQEKQSSFNVVGLDGTQHPNPHSQTKTNTKAKTLQEKHPLLYTSTRLLSLMARVKQTMNPCNSQFSHHTCCLYLPSSVFPFQQRQATSVSETTTTTQSTTIDGLAIGTDVGYVYVFALLHTSDLDASDAKTHNKTYRHDNVRKYLDQMQRLPIHRDVHLPHHHPSPSSSSAAATAAALFPLHLQNHGIVSFDTYAGLHHGITPLCCRVFHVNSPVHTMHLHIPPQPPSHHESQTGDDYDVASFPTQQQQRPEDKQSIEDSSTVTLVVTTRDGVIHYRL